MQSARSVGLSLSMNKHKFPYRWNLSDGYPAEGIDHHKSTVLTTFACGGGSSMGYKLAGFDVIGCNEIDPEMMRLYDANHHPKYKFLEDIRTFKNRTDLPEEFYNLDVLDGSPPCSVFSIAGQREDAWGKEKKFREGQAEQTLDDLFFEFIDLAKKLQPKVIIAENVKGLLLGNAKGYTLEIFTKFSQAGYDMQLFLLNAASMGVPQSRERVFFIGSRKDLTLPGLKLDFKEPSIPFKEIKTDGAGAKRLRGKLMELWKRRQRGDLAMSDPYERMYKKRSFYTHRFIYEHKVLRTIIAADKNMLFTEPRLLNKEEYCLASSFPLDYNFLGMDVPYIVGMSVPPLMMAQVAQNVYYQWLRNI